MNGEKAMSRYFLCVYPLECGGVGGGGGEGGGGCGLFYFKIYHEVYYEHYYFFLIERIYHLYCMHRKCKINLRRDKVILIN